MDIEKLARTWMTQMDERAETLTEILGLPSEAKHDVLYAAYVVDPLLFGVSQEALTKAKSKEDVHLKDFIHQLSEGFLNTHMEGQVAAFQAIWDRLKTLPLETLGKGFGQRPVTSQGLGFGGSQELLPVVSVISWTVVNQINLKKSSSEQIQIAIMREAQARGCSQALSSALALYLQPRLSRN